jgi:sporulation protein YlmC with PRC-barrel domain
MMKNRFLIPTALAVALGVSAGANAQTGTQTQPRQVPSNQPHHAQSGANVLLQEQPGDYLARQDLIGTSVRNAQNENVGEVDDLVIDKTGRVKGVVVGVGGFLGVGEKHVAMAWNELRLREPTEGSGSPDAARTMTDALRRPVLMANVTREQLREAPEFKRARDARDSGMRSNPPGDSTRPGGTTQ